MDVAHSFSASNVTFLIRPGGSVSVAALETSRNSETPDEHTGGGFAAVRLALASVSSLTKAKSRGSHLAD